MSLVKPVPFLCGAFAVAACCAAAACGDSSSSAPATSPDAGPAPDPDASLVPDGAVMPDQDAAGPTCMPKAGFETAVKLGAVGGQYAHESLALGPNDEPFVAFVAYDLADRTASALYFAAYDATNCGWKTPVKIDTVEDVTTNRPLREVQLVRDPSNGRLHVAYNAQRHLPPPNGDTLVMLAHSSDDGATWTKELVAHDNGAPADNTVYTVAHPTVAVANGKTVYAYYPRFNIGNSCATSSQCNGWVVLTRSGDSGAFAGGIVESASGAKGGEALSGAAAFDASGNAGFVFYSRPSELSPTLLLNYLKVGETKAVPVFDSQGIQDDSPALSLAFEGTQPRIAAALQRVATPMSTNLWFSASPDGTTWSAPVEMPIEGDDGMGTFVSLAANPMGGLTTAADFISSSGMRGPCGGPKMATTTNDTTFVTCGANPDQTNNDVGFAGNYVQIAYTKAGKRVLAFDYPADSAALKAGVTVWREP